MSILGHTMPKPYGQFVFHDLDFELSKNVPVLYEKDNCVIMIEGKRQNCS